MGVVLVSELVAAAVAPAVMKKQRFRLVALPAQGISDRAGTWVGSVCVEQVKSAAVKPPE